MEIHNVAPSSGYPVGEDQVGSTIGELAFGVRALGIQREHRIRSSGQELCVVDEAASSQGPGKGKLEERRKGWGCGGPL